jgi:starch phosphorylase
MNRIHIFHVSPSVPDELAFLEKLSRNLWWCWNADAIELFQRINPQLWRETGHNPIEFLSRVPQRRLEMLAGDEGFLSHLQQVAERFEAEVEQSPDGKPFEPARECYAYFSLEYGIHESVRFYSGGLGVLAGDHLKAASDLNLPLVGVGLLYREGYFRQSLDKNGWQQEHFVANELHRLPVQKAYDQNGNPVKVSVPLPKGELRADVWCVHVGRIPLFLLDANIPENPPDFRDVTGQVYGGDRLVRLRQELLLGIGGFRALIALGHEPLACHMNEGHAAFVSFAQISHLMKTKGFDLDTALEIVPRSNVFTTHTPAPAGNEVFAVDILKPHLTALEETLGIEPETVLSWGVPHGTGPHNEFQMTILSLRMANRCNGVSELHGQTARRMWAHLWPEYPEEEIPIGHITNGIHIPSWLSTDVAALYDRAFGPEWRDNPMAESVLEAIPQIPAEELWRAHELARSRLVRVARERLEQQLVARNATREEIDQSKSVLDLNALTIGFARRFATYKRGTLLLKDVERLQAILCDPERPVQIIFAGKAHPADENGKKLIQQIVEIAKRPELCRRIVFLENYDLYLSRCMVQGVDVWLNTPRRPMEASGTSGMKAIINGALHLSTLDGWWCEGYRKGGGWAIGKGEEYEDQNYQDSVEAQALYNLLENEVAPAFYERPAGDVPVEWTKMMKASIQTALSYFTSHRMTTEYSSRFYQPAMKEHRDLLAQNAERARNLLVHHKRLAAAWNKVHVGSPAIDKDLSTLHVGDTFRVVADVSLGELTPEEVVVQAYYGRLDSQNRISRGHAEHMPGAKQKSDGSYTYSHEITCTSTGRFGLTVRAIPNGSEWQSHMPGFITWADGSES